MRGSFDPEILILGGGGLGPVTALKIAQLGCEVGLVRISDSSAPQGDTFRNHGWLQSGLIYSGPRGLDLFESKLMYFWGRQLHRELYIEPPTEQGIFRTGFDDRAAQVIEASKRLKVPVDTVSDHEAARLLKELHKPAKHHFWVPDAPFDEARVLTTAREMAMEFGADLVDLPPNERPPHLELDDKEPNGYRVIVAGRILRPRITILCTGQALPSLLSQVNFFPPLAVFRSTLLRAENVDWIQAPLLFDLDTGFAIVNHLSEDRSKHWAVFGDSKRVKLTSYSRRVTKEEFDSAISFLPESLRGTDPYNSFKATAGHKTEILDERGHPSARHWIEEVPNCKGLFAAIPGKATVVLWVALEILKKAGIAKATDNGDYERILLPPDRSNSSPSSSSANLPPWDASVEMHWERSDLNDLCSGDSKDGEDEKGEAAAAGNKD